MKYHTIEKYNNKGDEISWIDIDEYGNRTKYDIEYTYDKYGNITKEITYEDGEMSEITEFLIEYY